MVRIAIFFSVFFLVVTGASQEVILNNPAKPSVALEVNGTAGGIKIPSLSSVQRDLIKSPAEGLIIFNTTNQILNYWNGGVWNSLDSRFVSVETGTFSFTNGIAINVSGDPASPSAILDIQSNEKGLLLPNENQNAIDYPVEGLIIYSTVAKVPVFYNATDWVEPCASRSSVEREPGNFNIEGISISETGNDPHPSSILDISVSGKGLLLPRLTDEERNMIDPAAGLIIYNTTTKGIQYYTFAGWFELNLPPSLPSEISTSAVAPWAFASGVIYSVEDVPGTAYNWTVPDGWTITSGQGSNQIVVTIGSSSGTIQVVAYNGTCEGVPRTLEVPVMQGFVTTWNTSNTLSGGSSANQVSIPMIGNGYNFTVYWGDGSWQTHVANPGDYVAHYLTKTYSSPGTYTVTITGNFPRIYFAGGNERNKLLQINQWGDIVWISMQSAFYGCTNLQGAFTDAPDLSQLTDLSFMFAGSSLFNYPISNWDVSSVTSMNGMFYFASAFNQPLSEWDVSSVDNMSAMFYSASAFNQPLDNWNVSSVTNMSAMFYAASAFNQTLQSWDVSQVTDFSFMFYVSILFNQPIGNWDVSSGTAMNSMFRSAVSFNQNLSGWCVSLIPAAPANFDSNATSWTMPGSRPVWGTCPP